EGLSHEIRAWNLLLKCRHVRDERIPTLSLGERVAIDARGRHRLREQAPLFGFGLRAPRVHITFPNRSEISIHLASISDSKIGKASERDLTFRAILRALRAPAALCLWLCGRECRRAL